MAHAIVQDGVIMAIGSSEEAAYRDAEEISLSGGLYRLDASAVCVPASEQALRDWNEDGPDASVYIDDTGTVRSRSETSNDVLACELWIILVDRKPRPDDPPFFAESEERAIHMWRQHTGLHRVHRERLSAVPKAALHSAKPKRRSHAAEVAHILAGVNSGAIKLVPLRPSLKIVPRPVSITLDVLEAMFLGSTYVALHRGDRLDITRGGALHAAVRVVKSRAVVETVASGKRAAARAAKVETFLASRIEKAKAGR